MLSHFETIIKRLGLKTTSSQYAEHILDKGRVFFDLPSWDRYISQFDMSIGSRFLGNLIALTNGIPAFILAHDSRTTEMAELMSIPYAPVDGIDVERILEEADFDAFEARYTQLYDQFAAFLTENGLRHKLGGPAL